MAISEQERTPGGPADKVGMAWYALTAEEASGAAREPPMPGAHIRDEASNGYLRIGRGPVAVAERDRNGGPPSSLSPNICAVLTARSVLRRGADYLLWRAAAGLAGLRIVPGDRFPKKARR